MQTFVKRRSKYCYALVEPPVQKGDADEHNRATAAVALCAGDCSQSDSSTSSTSSTSQQQQPDNPQWLNNDDDNDPFGSSSFGGDLEQATSNDFPGFELWNEQTF